MSFTSALKRINATRNIRLESNAHVIMYAKIKEYDRNGKFIFSSCVDILTIFTIIYNGKREKLLMLCFNRAVHFGFLSINIYLTKIRSTDVRLDKKKMFVFQYTILTLKYPNLVVNKHLLPHTKRLAISICITRIESFFLIKYVIKK